VDLFGCETLETGLHKKLENYDRYSDMMGTLTTVASVGAGELGARESEQAARQLVYAAPDAFVLPCQTRSD